LGIDLRLGMRGLWRIERGRAYEMEQSFMVWAGIRMGFADTRIAFGHGIGNWVGCL
jgi:hypothetical protein